MKSLLKHFGLVLPLGFFHGTTDSSDARFYDSERAWAVSLTINISTSPDEAEESEEAQPSRNRWISAGRFEDTGGEVSVVANVSPALLQPKIDNRRFHSLINLYKL